MVIQMGAKRRRRSFQHGPGPVQIALVIENPGQYHGPFRLPGIKPQASHQQFLRLGAPALVQQQDGQGLARAGVVGLPFHGLDDPVQPVADVAFPVQFAAFIHQDIGLGRGLFYRVPVLCLAFTDG